MKRKQLMFLSAFMAIFLSVLIGIIWSVRIEDSLYLMRVNLIILIVTLVSNLVIWIFGFVTYSYAEDMRERAQKFQNQTEEWEERLASAGLTLDKLSKFEPMLDQLGEVSDEIDVEKASKLVKKISNFVDDYENNVSEPEFIVEENNETN